MLTGLLHFFQLNTFLNIKIHQGQLPEIELYLEITPDNQLTRVTSTFGVRFKQLSSTPNSKLLIEQNFVQ